MLKPVMRLELDPRRRQQVQRRGGYKLPFLAHHELLADHARVWRPKRLLSGLPRLSPREVAPEAHACAAHARHLERVELAVRVPRTQEALVLERVRHGVALSLGRGVPVKEVQPAQLDAEEAQVEGAQEPRQFVPGDVAVDEVGDRDAGSLEEGGLEGWGLSVHGGGLCIGG